jgi:hypothetical protein
MSKSRSQWVLSALATFLLLGTSSPSLAVLVLPSTSVPLSGATADARPELAGLVLEDQLISFTIIDPLNNVIYQGTIQNRVVLSDTLGTLAFYFRIRDTDPTRSGSIAAVSRTGFRNGTTVFATDVDFRPDGLGSISPSWASRDEPGNEVDFYFANWVPAGAESQFVFVLTDATRYDAVGTLTLYSADGSSSGPLQVFAPIAP